MMFFVSESKRFSVSLQATLQVLLFERMRDSSKPKTLRGGGVWCTNMNNKYFHHLELDIT